MKRGLCYNLVYLFLPGLGSVGAVPVSAIRQLRAAVRPADLHDAGDAGHKVARHLRGRRAARQEQTNQLNT